MSKILFLDFDGVISTSRAWAANKDIEDFYDRWIDPIAVRLIADICARFNYQIVVTSTWRKFGKETCVRALGRANIWVHNDWCTNEIWPAGPLSSVKSRPEEICEWLLRNDPTCTDYLIIDDDSFMWTDEQRARWIKTDQLNGFSTENYDAVLNINGADNAV